jgi:hypothetical protein
MSSGSLAAILVSFPMSLLVVSSAEAELVAAEIVLKEGDAVGSSAVSGLGSPFTDGQGRVGFVAALADGQRAIWWDDGPVFFSGDALPDQLVGGESTMGVNNNGGFIYSPSFNGFDAVYTHGGKLLAEEDPCPPLPGLYSSFNSRPTMLPDGACFWIAGTSEIQGGSTTNRHLFMATDPTDPSTIVRVLGGGDVIEGETVDPTASNFDYWISDNGQHHIQMLETLGTPDQHLYVDGTFMAHEDEPTGQGDAWSTFDIVSINDGGDYIFTGDTDGDPSSDEFVAYNGTIGVREGDTLDGHLLESGFTLRAASINNTREVAHAWGSGTNEVLFLGDGENLQSSVAVLASGDEIDVNNDEIADYTVTDFNASGAIGPGLDLATDGYVYLEVDVEPAGGGASVEAILKISVDPTAAAHDAAAALPRLRAFPNPVHDATELVLALPMEGDAALAVFDASGRRIRTLARGWRPAGETRITWDGRNEYGAPVATGIYFVRATCGGRTDRLRLAVLR